MQIYFFSTGVERYEERKYNKQRIATLKIEAVLNSALSQYQRHFLCKFRLFITARIFFSETVEKNF